MSDHPEPTPTEPTPPEAAFRCKACGVVSKSTLDDCCHNCGAPEYGTLHNPAPPTQEARWRDERCVTHGCRKAGYGGQDCGGLRCAILEPPSPTQGHPRPLVEVAPDTYGPPSPTQPEKGIEQWTIAICPECRQIAEADENGCCACGFWLGDGGSDPRHSDLAIEVAVTEKAIDPELLRLAREVVVRFDRSEGNWLHPTMEPLMTAIRDLDRASRGILNPPREDTE